MIHSLGADQPQRPIPTPDHTQALANSQSEPEERRRKEKQLENGDGLRDMVPCSSVSPPAHVNDNEAIVITGIRALDVATGLRRIPAGFYVSVQHSGSEWRTANKPLSANDVVEWSELIPLPSDLSATICLFIYASFEFQPMLGDGEQLRKMTVTVDHLLDRCKTNRPFTFFSKDGDVVSPCSSISLAASWRKLDVNDPSASSPHRTTTKSLDPLEDVTNQAHDTLSRYRRLGSKHDLYRSINCFEHALNICPSGHPCRAVAQSNLAVAMLLHSLAADIHSSLDVSISLYRNSLASRPVGHPDRPSTLVHLAMVHYARFEKRRDGSDQAQAEALLHEAIDLSSSESASKRAAIFLLQLQAVGAIQKSAPSSVGLDSASGLPADELCNTGVRLLKRFERSGNLADLELAISLLTELVRSTSTWDHLHLFGLTNLGAALAQKFELLGDLRDLEQSISTLRNVVYLTLDGHTDKAARLTSLGGALTLRFKHLGDLGDLEEAISSLRSAIDFSPVCHFITLTHLGISLLSRFEHLGESIDLEEATLIFKDAVDIIPDGHTHKPACLCNLSACLLARFQFHGELRDLDEAISKQRSAIDLTPDDHAGKAMHQNNFSCLLYRRFERFGDPSDLAEAIFGFEEAVEHTPNSHPRKIGRLSNLGTCCLTRFRNLREPRDLEHAILCLEFALKLLPDGHPNRCCTLTNLGASFKLRFESFQELGDIEQAISILTEAIYLTPDGRPEKSAILGNLGDSLRLRFFHSRDLDDLEQAISRLSDAINLISDGQPDKPDLINLLGNSLLARFDQLGELNDLEQTISGYMEACSLTPRGHPNKPSQLHNLGIALSFRFKSLQELSDLVAAMSCFSEAACASTGPTLPRFRAAREWISCARVLRHPSLLDAYSIAISLLPQLAWIGFSLADRYIELGQGADVVTEAAAAALDAGHPEIAVEWLERGRSIVWRELFQLRSSFDELFAAYPEHARRLRELSLALEHASASYEKSLSLLSEQAQISDYRSIVSLDQETDKHLTLAIVRDKLLQEIRGLPGFERFLLHKEFHQLRALAHSGPVVIINAAKTRCDALVVLAEVDHVIHVPLMNFTLPRSKGLQNMLKNLLSPSRDITSDIRQGRRATRGYVSWESLLSTLWDDIAKPVLESLAIFIPGELLRIFWCPTGPFAFLPIHAAGLYGCQFLTPGQKLSDFVISSYVPTLSVLVPERDVASNENLRLVAVGQPHSDGQSRLPGVDAELKCIKTVAQSFPSARITIVESSTGTVDEVLSLLKDADWVHFACHGIQDAKQPVYSGLCLADRRRLKLCDIISLSRPRGGLAFLSACQTATGHKDLSDEAIHLAAGMLFAGYGGVIGTMWSISDRLAPRVAKDVYEQLFANGTRPNHKDAARALHDAVERLRESDASFVEWLPFIHVGL